MSRASNVFGKKTVTNFEGYPAYKRSLEERYLQAVLTNTFGNTFYANTDQLIQQSVELHKEMIATDPVFAAKALVFARNNGYMRLAPLYGLYHLSQLQDENYKGLFDATFERVVRIPSDLTDFLSILEGEGRGQGGRRVKRAVAKFLRDSMTEYWALKYNGRGRGYSLGDVVATSHPVAKDSVQSALFRYVMGRDVDEAEMKESLPQIYAFERLKKAETDEERVHWIHKGRLPYDIVTATVPKPSKAVWEAIMEQMPIFALLRHLNTLDRHGLLEDRKILDYIRLRLTDKETLTNSKILPFRFVSAFNRVGNALVRDALRQAVDLTFDNLPEIKGRTAVFLDCSASMSGEYLQIAATFAFALYRKTGGDGLVWGFNSDVVDLQPSLVDSILSQVSRVYAHGGTDTSAPINQLRMMGEHVDNIVLITDEEQNMGSVFYRGLREYRSQVHENTRAFIINVAPYGNALVPEDDHLTHYVYGWSDQVLQYLSFSTQGYGGLVDRVKSINL